MNILEDMGDWMFGGARRNRQRTEERHTMDMKRMQSLLDSEAGQTLRNKMMAAYYEKRSKPDPTESAANLALAAERLYDITDDNSEVIGAIQTRIKDLISQADAAPKRDNRAREFVGPPVPTGKQQRMGEPEVETSKSAAEYFEPQDETDVFEALGKKEKGLSKEFFPKDNEWLRTKEVPEVLEEIKKTRPLADYFQAPTETVPEGNIPKTYQQMGIESVDDQATLQEMQQALPDVDMRQEYEADPETMKKLMELWRAKKLTKKNLHKAFSMIQQSAQKSLGIA